MVKNNYLYFCQQVGFEDNFNFTENVYMSFIDNGFTNYRTVNLKTSTDAIDPTLDTRACVKLQRVKENNKLNNTRYYHNHK